MIVICEDDGDNDIPSQDAQMPPVVVLDDGDDGDDGNCDDGNDDDDGDDGDDGDGGDDGDNGDGGDDGDDGDCDDNDIPSSPGCTDATCGGHTASRFSMPLTSLGAKKYYLGIFFKVQTDLMIYYL